MFVKALIVGQNLMAKGAMLLTDAATDGTVDTTEKTEEAVKVVEKIADFVKSPEGITTLLVGGIVVAGVVLWVLAIRPAIRKNKKRR